MLYYNSHEADDLHPTTFLYALCPPEATCLRLDFTLVESDAPRDFIRVFDGPGRDSRLLATLGGKSGSTLLQASSGCLTFEFTRAEAGARSVWTALWRSQQTGDCIDPALEGPCMGIQDVCGPEYRENRPQIRMKGEKVGARWYRFVAAKDGFLNFTILPSNGFDDYDWTLFAADEAGQCPLQSLDAVPLAQNLAAGRGALAATGMGNTGDQRFASETGNPESSSIPVQKNQSYFLKINAPAEKVEGFRLLFNDVVLQCGNPGGEFLQIAHHVPSTPPAVSAKDAFTRNTQVMRLSLDEKANLCLTNCLASPAIFATLSPPEGRKPPQDNQFPLAKGIVQALIAGLKTGRFPAYSAANFSRPIHYGDLLDFASRMVSSDDEWEEEDSIYGKSTASYWSPEEAQLAGFENVIELITDEFFDKQTGQKKHQIRYFRLVWTDWEGEMPDYNVAVFRYSDVAPLLEKIKIKNGHNDIKTLSLKDFFIGKQFSYLLTWRSGHAAGKPAQGKFMQSRAQQLEDFKWNK